MTTTGTPLTSATGIDCVCYLAKDFARAKNFYQNTLGLKPSMDGDNWVEFDLSDGTTFALAKLPGDTWYPAGGVMFAVPDLEAAARRLREAGVKFYGEEIDESPVCQMAWCEDTEGNNFAIHQRKVQA
jgi:predicted enzyme related to lactoylglutathione lyase